MAGVSEPTKLSPAPRLLVAELFLLTEGRGERRVTGALKPAASARKPWSAANLGEGNTDFKPPLPCGYTLYGKGFES